MKQPLGFYLGVKKYIINLIISFLKLKTGFHRFQILKHEAENVVVILLGHLNWTEQTEQNKQTGFKL